MPQVGVSDILGATRGFARFSDEFTEKALDRRECERLLEEKVGYRFSDHGLLRESLTHKSFSNEQPGRSVAHNERLEFLGDAVLDLVVSHALFDALPDRNEGELSRVRAEVVSEKSLALLGRGLDLGGGLLLGKGEARSGGRDKDSLIADALEALLGAIFCDGGLERVRPIIEDLFGEPIRFSAQRKSGVDFKSRLQEHLQGRYGKAPDYVLLHAEGPDHQRRYTIEARFEGRAVGEGRGRTKKAAEQEAARRALERLDG